MKDQQKLTLNIINIEEIVFISFWSDLIFASHQQNVKIS